ncbi:hypothetical protein OHA25_56605 [Nonomuraea sp. NBC_00507]|uniref:hypothetical protein n=1 Tax=Nonomuraea sp. NBC_00507 TaxID=2976002 RepID=UPI002E19DD76
MRAIEIEAWVRRIVDRVERGSVVEDGRVELKSIWPDDANKAARRIAGHCNASAGEAALWIIGVDEKSGVAGVSGQDMAAWWAKVKSEFDSQAPAVRDLIVNIEGKEVIALAFETDRAPFVVRNPSYGKSGGGPVEREVPWRDGTSVRSATRADLIRLLLPTTALPTIDVISGYGSLSQSHVHGRTLHLTLYVYATLPMGQTVVLPNHQSRAFARIDTTSETIDLDINLSLINRISRYKHTVHNGDGQVILEGPGFFHIEGRGTATHLDILDGLGPAYMHATIRPAGTDQSIAVDYTIPLKFALDDRRDPPVEWGSPSSNW